MELGWGREQVSAAGSSGSRAARTLCVQGARVDVGVDFFKE